ncbi:MAG: hypothetical protein V3T59_01110 [Desulfobacterales bacterium]
MKSKIRFEDLYPIFNKKAKYKVVKLCDKMEGARKEKRFGIAAKNGVIVAECTTVRSAFEFAEAKDLIDRMRAQK